MSRRAVPAGRACAVLVLVLVLAPGSTASAAVPVPAALPAVPVPAVAAAAPVQAAAPVKAGSPAAQGNPAAEPETAPTGPPFRGPNRLDPPDRRRALLESGAVLAGLTVNYYAFTAERQIDRGFAEALGRVFSPSRFRLDDNGFNMNFLGHPIHGWVNYAIPRANGLSPWESFLHGLAASVIWEQFVELQELSSVNDHVVTPLAGFAAGEALFQAAMAFRRSAGGPARRAAGAAFAMPAVLTEVVPRRGVASPARLDGRGLPADVRSRIRLHAGAASRSGPHWLAPGRRATVGFEAEVSGLGALDGAGAASGWFRDVAATRLLFEASRGDGGFDDFRFIAHAVPTAWFRQHMTHTAAARAGYRAFVGPAVGFEFNGRGRGGFRPQTLALTLAGPAAELELAGGAAGLVLRAEAYGTFGGVIPYGRAGYDRPLDRAQTSLVKGYYHAVGHAADVGARLRFGPAELAGGLRRHRTRSLDGLDRFPDVATDPVPMRDDWTFLDARLTIRAGSRLELSVGGMRREGTGRMGEHGNHAVERGWDVRVAASP